MIVVQHETRFRALERFALELVPTERRVEHFYKGLPHEIQMDHLDRKLAILGNIVRAAGEVE